MGRHRVPVDSTMPDPSGAQRARRRTIGITTALVLTVGAGTFAALRSGVLPLGGQCADGTVRLRVAASPISRPRWTRWPRRHAVTASGATEGASM